MISGLLLTPNPLGSRSLPTMNANSSAFPGSGSRTGSAAIRDVSKSVTEMQSGYNKGTIRSDIGYLVVSKDVRRHRLISSDYIKTLRCHGRGREFESRRPRHSFTKDLAGFWKFGAKRPRKTRAKSFFSDHLANGAGFTQWLSENLGNVLADATAADPPADSFIGAIVAASHRSRCDSSCYDCLRQYRNVNYHGCLMGVSVWPQFGFLLLSQLGAGLTVASRYRKSKGGLRGLAPFGIRCAFLWWQKPRFRTPPRMYHRAEAGNLRASAVGLQ